MRPELALDDMCRTWRTVEGRRYRGERTEVGDVVSVLEEVLQMVNAVILKLEVMAAESSTAAV